MLKIFHLHKNFWSVKTLRWSAILSLCLLVLSLLANYYANVYVAGFTGNSVSDIILDNLPVFNVDFIFIEGIIIFWIIISFLLIKIPARIPFVLKSIALFIFIRSISISLTHIAAPPVHSFLDPYKWFLDVSSGNDLFFSSHAGLPFLMALCFWNDRFLRYFCIASSVLFSLTVLMGHLHYSIDVFAAFFITYTIYHMAQKFFAKDYALLDKTTN
jgi:hypothetical protein